MRRLFALTFLLVIPVLLSISCAGSVSPVEPSAERVLACDPPPPPPPEVCGEDWVCFMAGQNIYVGDVHIWNDGTCLFIDLDLEDGWSAVETHVAVADTLEGIPQGKSGSPQVGHFPYVVGECIDLTQWGFGAEVYVAVHAVVVGPDGQEETAWCCGDPFEKSWAMYFRYTIEECCKDVTVPDVPVKAQMLYPAANSYYNTYLSQVPGGYNVENGFYLGWCVDRHHYLTPNIMYNVSLFSSQDDNLPDCAQSDNWPYVNYILNHKDPNASKMDIQYAIWYFIGDEGVYPADPEAQAMIDEALAYGADFCPQPGDWLAVIVYIDCETQLTIIEVDP